MERANVRTDGAASVTPRRGGTLAGAGGGVEEGVRGLVCGVLFGIASPLSAHPLDTIKTVQQTGSTGGAWAVLRRLFRDGGVRRLYAGLLPPLAGSSVYRAVQFSAYGATMGALRDTEWAQTRTPVFGAPLRVLLAGIVASTARVAVETPLELLKVRRQTGQSWLPTHPGGLLPAAAAVYTGLGITWARTVIALGGYFVLVDAWDRAAPPPPPSSAIATSASATLAAFVKGAVCATAAWVAAWPLEVLKSSQQSGLALHGLAADATLAARGAAIVRAHGAQGLFRGIGPGVLRSVVGNGTATAVFAACSACLRPLA